MSFFEQLRAEPWRFDLLATLRRLERAAPDKPRIGDNATLAEEIVAIGQNPFLEFPASNLESAERGPGGRVKLIARFLGLFGPQGALPLTTTEEAHSWWLARDDAFARFADVIQRRFLALFFRAWAQARPVAQNDRPREDRFRDYLGSAQGVGGPTYRDLDSLSDFAKMEFAGLLAPRAKSASRLRAFVAGLFGVRAEIEEFVGAWLALEPEDLTRLGRAQSQLGGGCLLGGKVYSVSDRFRLRIFVRDLPQYERFLPSGDLARQVADAVFLHMGDEYDWDLQLALPAGQAAPVRLGGGARLGWTSWMAPNWSASEQSLRADARFHVVSRLGRNAQAEGS